MERLQKVLAQAGIASRRAAEQIILAGRVRVDGKIVRELGTQVDPRLSRIEVDGTKIVPEKLVYVVLHKPRGVVCTLSDPEGRPTIKELLKDAGARVVPVGRLDFHTSGALLCTNDGEFAQALAHPTKSVPKVYVAKVKGAVDDEALERFGERIVIDGRPTQPAKVDRLRFEGDKTWLEITLREGRNRQVRRLGEATGFPVMRLARISHAGVTSEDLRPGQWRPLTVDELVELKRDYGVPKRVRSPIYDPSVGRDAAGRGTAGRPTRGDERGAKRAKTPKDRRAAQAAELNDPFSRAARSVPKRAEGRPEKPRFEKSAVAEGVEGSRDDARGSGARATSTRSRSDERPAPKRFEGSRSDERPAPKRFEGSRDDARGVGARGGSTRSRSDERPAPKRFEGSRSDERPAPKRFEGSRSDERAAPKRFEGSRSDARGVGSRGGSTRSRSDERPAPKRFEGSRSDARGVGSRGGSTRSRSDERAAPKRFEGSRSDARGVGSRGGSTRSRSDERAAPKRFEGSRDDARGFGARGGSTRSRSDERPAPKRFEGKGVEARRAESKRGDEKRSSGPKRFEGKGVEARRSESKRGDEKRSSGPKRFEGKGVETRRSESKRGDEKRSSGPKRFEDQRGRAATGPSRPARSRSIRESAGAAEPIRAKRDGRASAPRRGTSR